MLTGDTCGAGDRLAAELAASLGSGAAPSEALHRAVARATEFVADRGTDVLPTTDPMTLADQVRASGGTVVATGGCFDLLHRGHLSLLQQARSLGDCLIVCLNSDASVTRCKGEGRPVVSQGERAAILNALTCVDAVLIFDEDTPEQALTRLRPQVWVKGGDYALVDIPERAVVERYGGHTVLVAYVNGHSTTGLIEQASRVGGQHLL